jgi:predicted transcriptional regulator
MRAHMQRQASINGQPAIPPVGMPASPTKRFGLLGRLSALYGSSVSLRCTNMADGVRPTDITQDGQDSRGNVVRNTFSVLRFLGRTQRPVGVTRLAAEVGIPRTTIHRLLEQMAREGVVIRRDGHWTLTADFRDLDRRDRDLEAVVRPRMCAMTQATGATLFIYRSTGTTLRAFARSYGQGLSRLVLPTDQATAAEHPASATVRALQSGQLTAEHGEAHPNCSGLAMPFSLPCGDAAVLSLGLPQQCDVEMLKRPLERLAVRILTDIERMEPL